MTERRRREEECHPSIWCQEVIMRLHPRSQQRVCVCVCVCVCVSQHVFPIWFHPVPQHWVHADLFPLSFFLSFFGSFFYCFFLSLAAKVHLSRSSSLSLSRSLSLSLTYSQCLSLFISPSFSLTPRVSHSSPLALLTPRSHFLPPSFHTSFTFISVTQHLDLMLVSVCVCVCLTPWCHHPNFSQLDATCMPSSLISLICCMSFCILHS